MDTRQEQQARERAAGPNFGLDAELTSVTFAGLARALTGSAKGCGLRPVGFRSPGGSAVGRAIRRNADGSATVAVCYRGRPAIGVAADMIEGIVQATATSTADASVRDSLWQAAVAALAGANAPERSERGQSHSSAASPRSPLSQSRRRSQSSAARRRALDSGGGPPEKATRRAA